MINRIQLVRNVGQFDSAPGGREALRRLTLIYAENGRGKTTLTAILRSLSSGDPSLIQERRRIGAADPPHVILDCVTGGRAVFQDDAWSRTYPGLSIFDDAFVDENVYSGLSIDPEHKQNLHELILGSQGVALGRRVQEMADRIAAHNVAIREKGVAIPSTDRGSLTIDNFCSLQPRTDIEEAIRTAETLLAAVQEQNPIRDMLAFDTLELPEIDLAAIERLLLLDLPGLDEEAAARVSAHLSRLAQGGESWVADGIRHAHTIGGGEENGPCPFCAQSLETSDVFGHYRGFFSEEYSTLKRAVSESITSLQRTHSSSAMATFERAVGTALERRQFWSRFCEAIPAIGLDTAQIVHDWQVTVGEIQSLLEAKRSAPLERIALTTLCREAISVYQTHRQAVAQLGLDLRTANAAIALVKAQAAAGNPMAATEALAGLKAIRARHEPTTSILCGEYLAEKAAKARTEEERDRAKEDLDTYRTTVFPRYRASINDYLRRFNVGFHLDTITPGTTRTGPTCNYSVVVNNTPIPVTGAARPGTPSFRTTLSSGDRNTLALAFFFASLDNDPDIASKVIVLDDPMTSLDEHRTHATVQEIWRLAARGRQVIVLSHSKSFLCRIWSEAPTRADISPLHVIRSGTGSIIEPWNVGEASLTEHDRRHERLRDYFANGRVATRAVAQDIRPLLEAFCRVAFPEFFRPGSMLGPFCETCRQRAGGTQEILAAADISELQELVNYANRFHHDTNPAWETENVNDAELQGYVRRALLFAR